MAGVTIPFEADMTRVRAAIAEIVADAARRPVVMNVGPGGGGGGGGGFAPPGHGSQPDAAGVFARSAPMAAGFAIPVGTAAGQFGSIPGGFAPVVGPIRSGVVGAGFGGPITAASVISQMPAPAATTPGGGQFVARTGGQTVAGTPAGTAAQPTAAQVMPGAFTMNVQAAGGFNASFASSIINNVVNNMPPAPAPIQPPVPQPQPARRSPFSRMPFGIGGLIGLGGAMGALSHAAYADRQYNIDSALAGSDQRGQLEAQLAYRESIAASGGFIGRTVAYFQDPGGRQEIGVRASLLAANLQDRRTEGMRENYERIRSGRDAIAVLQIRSPYNRELAQIQSEYEAGARQIDAKEKAQMETDRTAVRAQIASELDSPGVRSRIVARAKQMADPVGQGSADNWNMSLELATSEVSRTLETAEMAKRAERYRATVSGPELDVLARTRDARAAVAGRDEIYRLQALRSTVAGQIDAARFIQRGGEAVARNDNPNNIAREFNEAKIRTMQSDAAVQVIEAIGRGESWVDVARIAAAGQAKISAQRALDEGERRQRQRQYQYDVEDVEAATTATRSQLARNPLQARLDVIDARERRALRDPRAGVAGDLTELGRAIVEDAKQERALERQRDADEKRYRIEALGVQAGELRMAIADRPGAGRAFAAASQAALEAQRLREQENDPEGARAVLRNANLEQQAIKKQVLREFESADADPLRTSLTGPRGGEDVVGLLQEINNNMAALAATAKEGGGGIPGVTSD